MSEGGQSPLKRALRAIEDLQAKLAAAEASRHEPIAVIGIGCRIPGGGDGPEKFWDLLCEGRDAVVEVPPDRWDLAEYFDADPDAPGKLYTRWGAFLGAVDGFDPRFFGIAPREALDMDPQQRLLLEVAWEALEHAGQAPDRLGGTRTGVYIGLCSADYALFSPWSGEGTRVNAYSASGVAHSVASGRISYILGLRGPAITVDTACSSSLVAIHLGILGLRARDCRMAMAGGVHLMLSPDNTIAFCKTRMMSPVGRCKAFGAGADGFVLGEGCGVIVLKRLSDARADGDRVLAVIRGTAANQDGSSGGLTVPSGQAQADVIRQALADASIAPEDVVYVEAHGTGTSLGDPIEIRALASALGAERDGTNPLLVGSVKTNVGHLEAAAGVTGVIKAVLSLRNGWIPPHLHASTLSPLIPWEEIPVVVPTDGRAWPEGRRRIAGVSGFGFSGTNVHILLEDARGEDMPPAAKHERPLHLMTLSARTPAALRTLAARYAEAMSSRPIPLPDAAYTANAGRAHGRQRRAIVARSEAELQAALRKVAAGEESERETAGEVAADDAPRVVFLFTGQGAQSTGMGRRLYETQPTFRKTLDRCAAILRPFLDRPLLDLLFDSAESPWLEQTAYTQPALFSLEYALADLWRTWGVQPAAVMGHSLGEFVAACVAGVMTLEDGLALVTERGRLMQGLTEPGTMAAILTDEGCVAEAVARWGGRLSIAAVNAPRNVVVSGAADGVERLCREFARDGVSCKRLFVSHAFHSPLMDPIIDAFRTFAGKVAFAAPCVPLVSNVTGETLRPGEVPDREYWTRHLRSTVRFADSVAGLLKKGYRLFVEIGPRPTLSALGRMTAGDVDAVWLPSLRDGQDDWETMLGSLAALYVRGARIDWRGFDGDYGRRLVDLPTYPFERGRYWLERRRSVPSPSLLGRATSHPLIGSRLASPVLADFVSESCLSVDAPAFIGEHKVFGAVIMPATGFVEMAMAAAGACGSGGRRTSLRDFVVHEAMVFQEGESKVVQTVVEKGEGSGAPRLRIYSSEPDGSGGSAWRLHASASVASAGQPAGPQTGLEEAKRRCAREEDPGRLRAALVERGIDLGPRYRGITALWSGDGEALSRIETPAVVAAEQRTFLIHPALLDACLQTMGGALGIQSDGAPPDVYLPLSVDRLEAEAAAGALWCHATLIDRAGNGGETVTGRLSVFDAGGRRIAAAEGLVLKRTDPATLARVSRRVPDDPDRWIYEPAWEPSPVAPAGGARSPLSGFDPAAVLERLGPEVEALARERGFCAYPEAEAQIDETVAGFIVEALGRLGVEVPGGRMLEVRTLLSTAGVDPRFARLLARFLGILEERNVAERRGDGWHLIRGPAAGPPPSERCAALADAFPALRAELETLGRCGPFLAEVLRGQRDPLSLLFPAGATEGADALYRHSAASFMYNGLVAKIVREAVEEAGGERIRILEIGGGTGGTTVHLLPILPKDRFTYLFTDISPFFTARVAGEFAGHRGFRARPLDIEKSPGEQGLGGEAFDIVVCANVLHATRDLSQALAHVRSLLAPGGLLVLVEVVRPLGWVDATFGLTEGWWRFDDGQLRSAYPLISATRWERLLAESGFAGVSALPAAGSDGERRYGEVVLVARRPSEERSTGGAQPKGARWLLLADRGGVAERLSACLRELGSACTLVRPGGSFGRSEDGSVVVDPLSREDFRRLLAEGTDPAGNWTGVVQLWALDDVPASRTTRGSLEADVSRSCGGTLHLMQAIASLRDLPRLWLVTRGARSVGGAGTPVQPSQSLLWGLGRSATLEHPEWKCTNVDLSPEAGADDVANLLSELAADGEEERIAWRAEGRYVERLARSGDAAGDPGSALPPAGAYHLDIDGRGVLDNLRWREAERQRPGPGEVEIEVEATGLNFRDVLNAMGLYPGSPPPFGSECAGRVTAIGDGAGELRVGDPVVAIAAGSFGRFVTVPVSFVHRRPPRMTAVEAATVPIAGVTASFSLEHVAGLGPGERVLIHSAAGGVGLAAVRIAMRIGADVFATAGTPGKREFLTRIGVRHVLDSRSPSFAKAVLEATGGAGVHVVLNSLSGDAIPASLSVLAGGGRFVELGKRGIWDAERVKAARPDVRYDVVDWGATAKDDPGLVARIFRNVVESAFRGDLEIPPFRTFPASGVVEAFRCMNQGRHLGKIVVVHPRRRDAALRVRPDATYLVTGGLGGIGLRSAGWLAANGARNLVLLGRAEADDEACRRIREMEAAGATVRTVAGDVSDERIVERLVADLAEGSPPLRGIIHSAGTLDDGVIQQQEWRRFENVFAAKVRGAWNLDAATADVPLDFFVMYSSIASVFGSAGQSNHAAANAFLDALAHHRRALGLPGVSINWGSWAEVGTGARHGVGERLEEQGIGGIPPGTGLEILGRLLDPEAPQVAVTPVDWSLFRERSRGGESAFFRRTVESTTASDVQSSSAAEQAATWRAELAAVPPGNRRALLEARVLERAVKVLGLPGDSAVDVRRPLQEMGLDSLMAIELRNALAQGVGESLSSTLLFDHPTIEALVDVLMPLVDGGARAECASGAGGPGTEGIRTDVVSRIEDLSDEEVDRLLASRTGKGKEPGERPS